jgi:hypothetical protein
MGRTSISGLIARGQNMNSYNNSGIDSIAKWVDAFNAALQDLAEDIDLVAFANISYIVGTTAYDLPADFFEIDEVRDGSNRLVHTRRSINPYRVKGYFVQYTGSKYTLDLGEWGGNQTFKVRYVRLPLLLSTTNVNVDTPEVPTVGENALIYYAISRGLRNNNQPGQALSIEQMYERERKKIRDVAQRARIGG